MKSKNKQEETKPSFIEAARREQIIACTIDALAELGYVKASLAQIAKRAKISTSVISYYFAGKDDLMRAVIEEVYTDAARYMELKIDPNTPARELLRSYIHSNLSYGKEHLKELKALAEIILHWSAEADKPPTGAAPDEAILKPLEEILRWGQESGEFRVFDPHPMAVTIRKAIDSAIEQWLINPNIDKDAYIEELISLFDFATRVQK